MHGGRPGATGIDQALSKACEDAAMPRPATDSLARPPGCGGQARRGGRTAGGWRRWRHRAAWLWAGLLATGLALAAPPTAAADGPVRADLAMQVLHSVNCYRASQALPAWEPDADLSLIATQHSQHMALRHRISHDGFEARFAQARRRLCVENLAAGFDRAEPLLAAWLASPSHRDNLLAPRPRRAGLGFVAGYITLMACD